MQYTINYYFCSVVIPICILDNYKGNGKLQIEALAFFALLKHGTRSGKYDSRLQIIKTMVTPGFGIRKLKKLFRICVDNRWIHDISYYGNDCSFRLASWVNIKRMYVGFESNKRMSYVNRTPFYKIADCHSPLTIDEAIRGIYNALIQSNLNSQVAASAIKNVASTREKSLGRYTNNELFKIARPLTKTLQAGRTSTRAYTDFSLSLLATGECKTNRNNDYFQFISYDTLKNIFGCSKATAWRIVKNNGIVHDNCKLIVSQELVDKFSIKGKGVQLKEVAARGDFFGKYGYMACNNKDMIINLPTYFYMNSQPQPDRAHGCTYGSFIPCKSLYHKGVSKMIIS